jgi:hypothetical protein
MTRRPPLYLSIPESDPDAPPMSEALRELDDLAHWNPTRLIEKIEGVDSRIDEECELLRQEIDLLRARIERIEARDV